MGEEAPRICTPGESFCEGATLWACTHSGTDAVRSARCKGGDPSNPVGCHSTGCGEDETACCRTAQPTCRWDVTSPIVSAGVTYSNSFNSPVTNTGYGFYCYTQFNCATDDRLVVQWTNPQFASCDASVKSASVYIQRPLTTPGQVFTLPNNKVQVYLTAGDPNQGCSTWTGSVTWDSDLPNWKVRVDATCSATGKSHIKLVGTYSGGP